MITYISYNFSINEKFIATSENAGQKIYGEHNTYELEVFFKNSINNMQAAHDLIAELNRDLTTKSVAEKCEKLAGRTPRISILTQKKRTYSILGLTIHEEDK